MMMMMMTGRFVALFRVYKVEGRLVSFARYPAEVICDPDLLTVITFPCLRLLLILEKQHFPHF